MELETRQILHVHDDNDDDYDDTLFVLWIFQYLVKSINVFPLIVISKKKKRIWKALTYSFLDQNGKRSATVLHTCSCWNPSDDKNSAQLKYF
jgi:hypothetical protein